MGVLHMHSLSISLKLGHQSAKYLHTIFRSITNHRNSIKDCYRSVQTDDEVTLSLIDLSISNSNTSGNSNSGEKYNNTNNPSSDFIDSNTNELWLDYESFKKNPRYQDLTHEEYTKLYELRAKERYNEFKRHYNIKNLATNPIYQGKLILREIKKSKDYSNISINEDNQDDFINENNNDKKTLNEIVSRIRSKVRSEKLANSKVARASVPSVDGIQLDQIKAHVKMRCVRISSMLATHIEHIITNSSPTIVKEILNDAAISIHHVKMHTSKSTCKVYYTILSDHDPGDIQRHLDSNAWKIRFFIAKKLQLGYTPPIKFVNQSPTLLKNIPNLFRKVVPPYTCSIESPLPRQPLIKSKEGEFIEKNLHFRGFHEGKKATNEKQLTREAATNEEAIDETIQSHIREWRRTISGFG